MILFDTDVVIELTRGHELGRTFLEGLGDTSLCISSVVAMEFLIGSRDRPELQRAIGLLSGFQIINQDNADNDLAMQLVKNHCLATGLSIPDYFIAAQALNRNATLFTLNLRHFGAISALDARAPYQRPK